MELPHYDLHCHSTASDGSLSPQELIERAKRNNIKVLALTDHDTISGYELLSANPVEGIELIVGSELTCLWNRRVIHVVGLGLQAGSESLQEYFSHINTLRVQRAKKIAQQLKRLGLPDIYEEARALAGDGTIGRPHFAKVLLKNKLVATEQQAFKKYLGVGKKGDVKMEWPSLGEAISVIKEAGGFAVLAHPTKYKMTFSKLREVIADFVDEGGQVLEVSYPGMTPDHHNHLLRIAEQYNLMISAGSDFHTPSQGWTDLGKYPRLKTQENHVLGHLLSGIGQH